MRKALVLIVDDSALVRQILRQGLEQDPLIKVVGTANDPYEARDLIVSKNPNVLTLDIEMPRMDGVQFLKKLMPQYPLPTIMVSSLTKKGAKITLEALESGAVDFVTKPSNISGSNFGTMITELQAKVKTAAQIDFQARKMTFPTAAPKKAATALINSGASQKPTTSGGASQKVIAIGASTGGTEALRQIALNLPTNTPGIVVVQHMPAHFTTMFASRLNQESPLNVKEAETGDVIRTGQILIAPGDKQMTVKRASNLSEPQYFVECNVGEKVSGHCPSVDVLFQSVAKNVGANAVGAVLTGMGADGADASVLIRKAGGRIIAQDEKTSIVFGMPYEAYKRGGAERLVPLDQIPNVLIKLINA